MKILKDKKLLLSPILVFIVTLVFSLTMNPSVNPTPKNLPIAIVNEDQGVQIPNQAKINMGETILQKIQNASKGATNEEPAVKWMEVKSEELAKAGLNNQNYYAALIIPKDFSQKQASLQTPNPSSPEVQILVNQGMNTMVANMTGQMLNQMVDGINNNIRTTMLAEFEKQGATLTAKQAAILVSPIAKKVINVNEIGTNSANGNAPMLLFQPLWIASIIGSVLIFLTVRKIDFTNRVEKFSAKFIQVLVGVVLSFVVGFGMTWICSSWIGLNIPHFTETALFLTMAYFCYYLMISAVLSWIGFGGIPLFVLILFFGAPLLAMAPELMSSFYREWIYSWLPMRFSVEGLRQLFYFGNGLSLNHPTSVLLGIGLVSLVALLASALKPNPKKERVEKNSTQCRILER